MSLVVSKQPVIPVTQAQRDPAPVQSTTRVPLPEDEGDESDIDPAVRNAKPSFNEKEKHRKFGKGKAPKAAHDVTDDHVGQPDHLEFTAEGQVFLDHNGNTLVSDPDGSDNTSEIDAAELAERKNYLAGGREQNRQKRAAKQNLERPDSIERVWRKFYLVVKGWWGKNGKELTSGERRTITKLQTELQKKCDDYVQQNWDKNPLRLKKKVDDLMPQWRAKNSKLSEYEIRKLAETEVRRLENIEWKDAYKFPVDRLHGMIHTAAAALHEIQALEKNKKRDAEDEQFLKEERMKLVQGIAVFTEGLNEHSISAQFVVSDYARQMFYRIVNASDETRAHFAKTISELNKPTKEQKDVWVDAVPETEKVIDSMCTIATDEATEEIGRSISVLKQHNRKLQEQNETQELQLSANNLPLGNLVQMQLEWQNGNSDALEQSQKRLAEVFKNQPLAAILYKKLQVELSLPEPASTIQAPVKSAATSAPTPIATTPTLTPIAGPSGQSTQPKNPLFDSVPRSSSSNRPTTTKPPVPTTTRPQVKDFLNMTMSSSDIITMPDYADGVTEFGRVVATRQTHSDNHKFSRFILFAGTDNCEHHRVVRGSDLGPGGAEALSAYKEGSDFDLRKRKREIKSNKVVGLGPSVVMPRSKGYVAGPKSRQPDCYTQVRYANAEIDWLCRTELCQFLGKKYAERKLLILTRCFEERVRYFEAHQEAKLHPDTKEPLSEVDREESPWLFPEEEIALGGVAGGATQNNSGYDSEVDMDYDSIVLTK